MQFVDPPHQGQIVGGGDRPGAIRARFIRETLEAKEGADWIEKLPPKIKTYAEVRQKAAQDDSWLEGEKSDLLGFTDFGHLSSIIIDKWQHFEDIMPTQHWLKQRLDELEKTRHFYCTQPGSASYRISARLYVHR